MVYRRTSKVEPVIDVSFSLSVTVGEYSHCQSLHDNKDGSVSQTTSTLSTCQYHPYNARKELYISFTVEWFTFRDSQNKRHDYVPVSHPTIPWRCVRLLRSYFQSAIALQRKLCMCILTPQFENDPTSSLATVDGSNTRMELTIHQHPPSP
jgi:hypothetical protein